MAIILLTSSIAHSSDCLNAAALKVGEQASCTGLLISHEQAKRCLKCQKVELPTIQELLRLEEQKSKKYKLLSEALKRDLDIASGASIDSGYTMSTVLLFAVSGVLAGFAGGVYLGAL